MRFIYFIAVLLMVAVIGCNDGKFNLSLVLWSESEMEPSSDSPVQIVSSSSAERPPSSSSISPPSSSTEEPPPPPSSSSFRGFRSSTSKAKDGYEYEDYPTLEEGALGVDRAEPGGITRYWDGCKPSCSRVEHLVQDNGEPSPNGIARTCDVNGNEMPLFYRMNPISPYFAEFLSTPNACVPDNTTYDWPQSKTYEEWAAANPGFPTGARAAGYVCSAEQIPYAVNDTLAYAFAANSAGNCGKCFQIQFRGDWNYGAPRPSHRAIAGKTLIVMVNNFGVGKSAFDVMIPGGGPGDYNAVSDQLGMSPENLGRERGGLLTECIFGDRSLPYEDTNGGLTPHERATLEESQDCLRAKCYRAFKNHPVHLKGCLWHVDWFKAVDNPEGFYKEVPCPKYLAERYGSTIPLPTRPGDLNPDANCKIGGGILDCPAP